MPFTPRVSLHTARIRNLVGDALSGCATSRTNTLSARKARIVVCATCGAAAADVLEVGDVLFVVAVVDGRKIARARALIADQDANALVVRVAVARVVVRIDRRPARAQEDEKPSHALVFISWPSSRDASRLRRRTEGARGRARARAG